MDNLSLSPSSSSESLSTSDLEAGFSGTTVPFPTKSSFYSSNRKNSSMYRGSMVGPIHSPRFFSDPLSDDETHHFLDSCFLCKKPLSGGRDIYMYRGDTPFCSEECRQEQIEMDETKEKWKISVKAKEKSNSKSPSKSQKIHMSAAGTVVAG